jgi:hypothetical protein
MHTAPTMPQLVPLPPMYATRSHCCVGKCDEGAVQSDSSTEGFTPFVG